MVDKEEVTKEKLSHSGIFSFSDFYAYAHSWLKDEKYLVNEDKYTEKLSGNTKDIEIEWRALKEITDYFKFEIKIRINGDELKEVEAEIDGEKKKMNKGKIGIEIKGTIIQDPKGKWDTSPLWRFLKDFYNKFVIPRRVEDMKETLITHVKSLKEDLKAFLELEGKR